MSNHNLVAAPLSLRVILYIHMLPRSKDVFLLRFFFCVHATTTLQFSCSFRSAILWLGSFSDFLRWSLFSVYFLFPATSDPWLHVSTSLSIHLVYTLSRLYTTNFFLLPPACNNPQFQVNTIRNPYIPTFHVHQRWTQWKPILPSSIQFLQVAMSLLFHFRFLGLSIAFFFNYLVICPVLPPSFGSSPWSTARPPSSIYSYNLPYSVSAFRSSFI